MYAAITCYSRHLSSNSSHLPCAAYHPSLFPSLILLRTRSVHSGARLARTPALCAKDLPPRPSQSATSTFLPHCLSMTARPIYVNLPFVPDGPEMTERSPGAGGSSQGGPRDHGAEIPPIIYTTGQYHTLEDARKAVNALTRVSASPDLAYASHWASRSTSPV